MPYKKLLYSYGEVQPEKLCKLLSDLLSYCSIGTLDLFPDVLSATSLKEVLHQILLVFFTIVQVDFWHWMLILALTAKPIQRLEYQPPTQ